MAKEEEKFDFSKAFQELEKIVAEFETGEVDLEKDLKKFEQGLKLAKACKERLKQLENQVHKIEKEFEVEEGAYPEEES